MFRRGRNGLRRGTMNLADLRLSYKTERDESSNGQRDELDVPVTSAFIPFFVPGTVNVCVRLYENPTRRTKR